MATVYWAREGRIFPLYRWNPITSDKQTPWLVLSCSKNCFPKGADAEDPGPDSQKPQQNTEVKPSQFLSVRRLCEQGSVLETPGPTMTSLSCSQIVWDEAGPWGDAEPQGLASLLPRASPPHPTPCLVCILTSFHSKGDNGHREHTFSSFHSFHTEWEPPVGRCPVLPHRPRRAQALTWTEIRSAKL